MTLFLSFKSPILLTFSSMPPSKNAVKITYNFNNLTEFIQVTRVIFLCLNATFLFVYMFKCYVNY